LPLPFILPNNETFDSFYVGDNQLLFDSLQTLLDREGFNVFYIWSASAAGRTHLLHASLGVLRSPDIPSILIEVGFITNQAEESLLG